MIEKILAAINTLKEKKSKCYFYVPDTGSNVVASIKYTYDIALAFKKAGFETILFHEKEQYTRPKFGEKRYEDLTTISFKEMSDNPNHLLSASDFIFVGELYVDGLVGSFRKNKIPSKIVVISQSYDYILQFLEVGASWDVGFNIGEVLTTSDKQAMYIKELFPFCETYVVPPFIPDYFGQSKFPKKPFVAIQSRFPSVGEKLIKAFYLKYPFYSWIPFKTLGSLSPQDFANELKECCLAVWLDEPSSFGTFPLECMKSNVPLVATVPTMVPEWMGENGFWTTNGLGMEDEMAYRLDQWLHNETEGWAEKNKETFVHEKYTEKRFDEESQSFVTVLVEKRIKQLEKLYGQQKQKEDADNSQAILS